MLNVQQYLRDGKTLEDLAIEHKVQVRINNNLVNLTYDSLADVDPYDVITNECRGLILELGTWDVVSKSFNRFFNYGQPGEAPIDWNAVEVLEKLDGTLIVFYQYQDVWYCHTKQTTQAEGPVGDTALTFAGLVNNTLMKMGWTWEAFVAQLNPQCSVAFELTTPENRQVVAYADYKLTFVSAWDKQTLQEVSYGYAVYNSAIPKVQAHKLPSNGVDAIIEMVNARNPDAYEGVVVKDVHGNRVKVKSVEYVMAHRAANGLRSEKSKLQVIVEEKLDDLRCVLPDTVVQELEAVDAKYRIVLDTVVTTYVQHCAAPTQKDFALAVKDYPYSGWLFMMHRTPNTPLHDVIKQQLNAKGIKSVYTMYCTVLNQTEEVDTNDV